MYNLRQVTMHNKIRLAVDIISILVNHGQHQFEGLSIVHFDLKDKYNLLVSFHSELSEIDMWLG